MSSLPPASTVVPGFSSEPSSSAPVKSQLQAAVDAAVWWWGDFLKKSNSLPGDVVKKFEDVLRELIIQKISDHWYPEMPAKGQAFRSLLVDKKAHVDPLLSKAAATVSIDNLISYFSKVDSVLMWIDPDVVIVRIAYTGYSAVPPEDKILYRSNLGTTNLKIISSKPLKTSTPPPIARPGILRTSPPGSPSSNTSNPSFLTSYRSSSPGLNSNAAQYFPTSLHYTHPPVSQFPKPAYIPAQRHPSLIYNNLFNQTQYMSWPNANPGPYTENWNEPNTNNTVTTTTMNAPSNTNPPQNGTNRQQPNKMYIDYIDAVLPLEAQA